MSIALLVLRLIVGLLIMGHGLQKLVPGHRSPPLLHATGPRPMAGFFEQVGLRPGVAAVVLAGLGELLGGILLALGLLTLVAAALIAAVMTTAILRVHLRKGIWSTEGGFELPLTYLTVAFVVAAIGPGRLSVYAWETGLARAGIAVAIGVVASVLATAALGNVRQPTRAAPLR